MESGILYCAFGGAGAWAEEDVTVYILGPRGLKVAEVPA